MKFPYHDVLSSDRLRAMLDEVRDHPLLVVDLETTGLDPYAPNASIVSLSLTALDESTWVVPLNHPQGPWGARWWEVLDSVVEAIVRWGEPTQLVAHNAQFDIRWMQHHTSVPCRLSDLLIWDTMAVAHLLDENSSKRLKSLAAHLVGGDWGIDVRDAYNVPWFDLAPYNAIDTIATLRLMKKQARALNDPDHMRMRALWTDIVRPAARTLTEVTHRGVLLDRGYTEERRREAAEEQHVAEALLMEHALNSLGMDPLDGPISDYDVSWAPTSKWFRRFTDLCTDSGDLRVMEVTKTGRPSWRAGVLEKLAREGARIAELVLQQRHGEKQCQFLDAWLDSTDEFNRIHANFNIARTRTGRLSSSDPNLQQVSRELKGCFRARGGWSLVEIDYSQVELRMMAEFIHRDVLPDNPMMQAYLDRRDLHTENATLVTKGNPEDVTPEERQKGKAVSFGFVFGMQPEKFVTYAEESYGVDFTIPEAEEVYYAYFDRWKGLGEWHTHQRDLAQKHGYVENLFGRRRRLLDVFNEDQWQRWAAERQAINSPIQATASDIMLLALGRVESQVDRAHAMIVGTVHDSALLEVRTDVVKEVVDEVCRIMLVSDVDLTVPLEVEAQWGTRWGDDEGTLILHTDDLTTRSTP